MRKLLPLIAAGIAMIAAPVSAAGPDREAEVARAIEGRVAGEPVDCIDLHRVSSSRIVPGTAIIYDAGGTVYINRPRGGAEAMGQWDIMVNRLYGGSRLCSIDTVQLIDQSSRMYSGTVFLGEFVPYRRVRTSNAQ